MAAPPFAERIAVRSASTHDSRTSIEAKLPPGAQRLLLAQIREELAALERQRRGAMSTRAAALITSAIHERYAELGLLARAGSLASRSAPTLVTPDDARRSV